MIPHKCPICDGTGKVSRPPWIAGDVHEYATTSCGPWPCHVCVNGIIWGPPLPSLPTLQGTEEQTFLLSDAVSITCSNNTVGMGIAKNYYTGAYQQPFIRDNDFITLTVHSADF